MPNIDNFSISSLPDYLENSEIHKASTYNKLIEKALTVLEQKEELTPKQRDLFKFNTETNQAPQKIDEYIHQQVQNEIKNIQNINDKELS